MSRFFIIVMKKLLSVFAFLILIQHTLVTAADDDGVPLPPAPPTSWNNNKTFTCRLTDPNCQDKRGRTEWLRYHVLENIHGYNPALAPSGGNYTQAMTYVVMRRLNGASDRDQQLAVQITVFVEWHDERIGWNNTDWGIDSLTVSSDQVWTPHIQLVERVSGSQRLPFEYVVAAFNGEVFGTSTLTENVYCNFDLYKFPFDTQNCTLTFESRTVRFWPFPVEQVVKEYGSAVQQIRDIILSENSEFRLLSGAFLEADNEVYSEPLQTSVIVFHLDIKRASRQHIVTTILPPIMLSLTGTLNLFYSTAREERQGYGASVVVALSVMFAGLTSKLPETMHAPPLAALLYFGLTALFMLGTVLVGVVSESPCKSSSSGRATISFGAGQLCSSITVNVFKHASFIFITGSQLILIGFVMFQFF